MGDRDSRGHAGARRHPLFVSLELDAKLLIEDPEISIPVAHDRLRHHLLHFLRNHADISAIAAIIAEAIETNSVVEPAERNDVVLEHDV